MATRLGPIALALSLLPLYLCLATNAEDVKKTDATAAAEAGKDGFVSLFNGKDLAGWVGVNNAPGTFAVKDGTIVTTGIPTGFLRSAKRYENFILELEWKHLPPKPGAVGNSGLFVWADPVPAVGTPFARAVEVQVLVNLEWKDKKTGKSTATSHGDIFSIWGAKTVPDRPHPLGWERCIPAENRAKGPGEWNHYRIEAKDGVIKLAVNGKVVSGVSKTTPRKGYLALEAEGSECRFRNLRIKELPSSNPKPSEVADEAKGHTTLFTGIDLSGWKTADDGQKKHWKAEPGWNVIRYDGKAKGRSRLSTEKKYGDFELICDYRAGKGATGAVVVRDNLTARVPFTPGKWVRTVVQVKGDSATWWATDSDIKATKDAPSGPAPITLIAEGGPVEFTNLFIRELKDGK